MDWYLEINSIYKQSNSSIKIANRISASFMELFFDKLINMKEYNLSNVNEMLFEVTNKFPIMSPQNDWKTGEFYIRYNSNINIRLRSPLKSIYRELKLNQLLNE